MRRIKKGTLKILLCISLGLVASCGSDSPKGNTTVDSFSFGGSDFTTLIQDLNSIDQALTLNQVLQNDSQRFKGQIVAGIRNARSGALILQKYGSEDPRELENAFNTLTTAIGQYEAFGVLEVEQSRFDKVFERVRELRYLTAKSLGIEDSFTWVMFSENFGGGIEPSFYSFPGKGKFDLIEWVTNFQIDIPKAQVNGREGHSWIVSAPMDIENIEDPSFRYFSSYNVAAPTPKNTLKDVIQKAFKTYVILDLQPGEDPHTIEDENRKILINYDIDDLPLARDFHDAWTPLVSLERFKGHKVSIGFMYDTRIETLGRDQNYYSWSIFDFEFRGRGQFVKPKAVYKPNFNNKFGGFKNLPLAIYSSIWDLESKNSTAIAIKSGAFDTDTMLLSDKYYISSRAQSVSLVLDDGIMGSDFGSAEVLISTNYSGGVNPLTELVEWDTLEIKSDFYDQSMKVYDLTKYRGKAVVLGFRFKALSNSDFSWKINDLYLQSNGNEVTVVEYSAPDTEQEFMVANFALNSANKSLYKLKKDSDGPRWKPRKNEMAISGFVRDGDNLLGGSGLLIPEVDLSGAKSLKYRIVHAMKHYAEPSALKVAMRESCLGIEECTHSWIELSFPEGTFQKFVDDLTPSVWVDIPEVFLGKKVEVSLFYKGGDRNTPEWRVSAFQIGGEKE